MVVRSMYGENREELLCKRIKFISATDPFGRLLARKHLPSGQSLDLPVSSQRSPFKLTSPHPTEIGSAASTIKLTLALTALVPVPTCMTTYFSPGGCWGAKTFNLKLPLRSVIGLGFGKTEILPISATIIDAD